MVPLAREVQEDPEHKERVRRRFRPNWGNILLTGINDGAQNHHLNTHAAVRHTLAAEHVDEYQTSSEHR